MLHVATCLWSANRHTQDFSRGYNEEWANKLYRGFVRNLTVPFRFVVFTEKERKFGDGIKQELLGSKEPDYGSFTEPYRLNEPMILVGLDTIVVENIDHFAEYCLKADKIALPRDPYQPERSINGVALVPAGWRKVFDDWRGENDMEWLRMFPWQPIDDLWPGEVRSVKAHRVRDVGIENARIVYCHGRPKMDALTNFDWCRENWR